MASPASGSPPPEGARETTPRSEAATAADHRRRESRAAREIAGTAAGAAGGMTAIRVEVDRRVPDTKTSGIQDAVGTSTAKTGGRLDEQPLLFLKEK